MGDAAGHRRLFRRQGTRNTGHGRHAWRTTAIGSGVAGFTAAYLLGRTRYDVLYAAGSSCTTGASMGCVDIAGDPRAPVLRAGRDRLAKAAKMRRARASHVGRLACVFRELPYLQRELRPGAVVWTVGPSGGGVKINASPFPHPLWVVVGLWRLTVACL
ncbi:hypothetical protein F3K21_00720 [Streptomyces scabiei]|nr:hypothetical protein [Streptomyces sp. LBUM 1485]QTU51613.1 hypothetical protein F3K21_00720 [Streptomyces sp. LBUM 1480]